MSRKYTKDDVINALKEIEEGASISVSAKKYGIPRSTLSEKKSGRHPIETKMGPATILTQNEEAFLVKWILHLFDSGFPISKNQLLDSVQKLLNEMNRVTIFPNNRPGRKWYKAFRKRHPIITERESQNLTQARASVTEKNIRDWFEEVFCFINKQNLADVLDEPTRIFNMDESGFYVSPQPGKVLARKGEKHVFSKIKENDKECITTLIGASADGTKIPPMVLFPYKRLPSHIVREMPHTWALGRSTKGWMTCETFYEYIANCFYPWLLENKTKFPIIVFLDGHASHISYHLSHFCAERGIILIALYPNATHIIQPMDVSVFRPLKLHWHDWVLQWRLDNNGGKLSREKFSSILADVLYKFIDEDIIKNGFKKCGLYPFDQNAIDYADVIKKPKETEKEDAPEPVARSEFLDLLESRLGAEKLLSFKLSGPMWQGSIFDVNLFRLWQDNGGISSGEADIEQNTLHSNVHFEFIDNNGAVNAEEAETSSLIPPENFTSQDLESNQVGTFALNNVSTADTDSEPIINRNESLTVPLQPSLRDHNPTIVPGDSSLSIIDSSFDSNRTSEVRLPLPFLDTNPFKTDSQVATNIPNAFKGVFFWPGTYSDIDENPKQKKVPLAHMSKKLNSYLDEVGEEKQKLQNEKSDRKKLREKKLPSATSEVSLNTLIAAPGKILFCESTSSISEYLIDDTLIAAAKKILSIGSTTFITENTVDDSIIPALAFRPSTLANSENMFDITIISAPKGTSVVECISSASQSIVDNIPKGMPAPFKSALFWPVKKAVKRDVGGTKKTKTKNSAFLTSSEFINALKDADDNKQKLLEEKLDRKKQRELKAREKKDKLLAKENEKKVKLFVKENEKKAKLLAKENEKKAKLLAKENEKLNGDGSARKKKKTTGLTLNRLVVIFNITGSCNIIFGVSLGHSLKNFV